MVLPSDSKDKIPENIMTMKNFGYNAAVSCSQMIRNIIKVVRRET